MTFSSETQLRVRTRIEKRIKHARLSSSFVQSRKNIYIYIYFLIGAYSRGRRSRGPCTKFSSVSHACQIAVSFASTRNDQVFPPSLTARPTRCDTHYRPNDSAACFNIYYCIPRAPSSPCIVPRSNAIHPSICFDPPAKGVVGKGR